MINIHAVFKIILRIILNMRFLRVNKSYIVASIQSAIKI